MLPKTFSPPKENEKRGLPKIAKVLIFLFIFIGALIYFFFYSSIFKIKNIIIEKDLPAESSSLLEKFKNQNILLVSSEAMEKEITRQYPELTNVKIQRGLPDTLRIAAIFYQSKIVWQTLDQSFLVNSNGIAFKEVEGLTDLPIIIDKKNLKVDLGSQVVSPNFIEFVNVVISKFSEKVGFKIVNFAVSETIFQVEALTDQGWFIKFDTTRSVDDQLDALSKLLAEHKDEIHQYVDVRVEGRVYWK